MQAASIGTIRVAVVNDYEIVVAGVRAMLRGFSELTVVDLDDRAVGAESVDIVLYDNFAQRWHDNAHLEDLIARSGAKVVVFTWTFEELSISRAYAAGAWGYLSKGLSAVDIVASLQRVHAGQKVTSHAPARTEAANLGDWPGQVDGLTSRESEILALITQGLSNTEIASATYLSINSVKTYIRAAYRKIGVQTRSHAVRYGMLHGFEPARTSAVT